MVDDNYNADKYDLDEDFNTNDNEKVYEDVFARDEMVYFLEESGTWYSNTFKTSEIAKKVVELYLNND